MKQRSRIYLHFIWSVFDYEPLFNQKAITRLNRHIKEYATSIQIPVIEVNGYQEHYHIIIDLPPSKSPAQAINFFKGESSNWINKYHLFSKHFNWSNEYFVFSVSESKLQQTIEFIQNQSEYHHKISFREELRLICKKHNIAL